MKKIFLDTSIYISNNFDFEGEKFTKLVELITTERIQLFSTTITDNEVISNINKKIEETRQFVTSIVKHAYVLKNTSPFKSVFVHKKAVNTALVEIRKQYEDFKKEANIIDIPINTVDIDEIFKRYFAELPPFSSKKKDEIPDAITLNAIKSYCQEKDDTCYIISTDKDMLNYCEEIKELIYLDSVDSLLDIIASDDAERYENIMRIFETIHEDVLKLVKENLFDISFELSDVDGEIEEVDLGDVEFSYEPLITEIGEDFAKISFEVLFDYVAHCSVFDTNGSPYDSETKGYLWKDYTSEVFHGNQELTVEVLLTNIDFEQITPEDVDIEEIKLNNNETIFISTWYDND